MLVVGSFFNLVYGPLVRCSLHFLMQSSLSSTTMALPVSAGRMMMFSFCWRDFKDVDCFLVMFLLGGFALWMIENIWKPILEKAKQRKQLPKLQHHQAESAKVHQ